MGTIADKLNYLNTTKQKIKTVMNAAGCEIDDTTTFRNYATILNNQIKNIINNDLDLFDLYPSVSGSGTNVTLEGTDNTKLKIKFNPTEITQSGTPSPDSPVDVNVIKGDNTITISNKNLLGLKDLTRSNNGITGNVSNNEITLNGTATNNAFIRLDNNGDSYLFNLKAGTYTLSANNNIALSSSDYLRFVTSPGGMAISGLEVKLNSINASTTFTLNEDLTNIQLQIRIASGTSLTDYVLKPQLEFGTASTEYVSPESQNFSINLGDLEYAKIDDYEDEIIETTGKNLFDKDNANLVPLMKASGGDYFIGSSGIKSLYIKVKPNTKYTIQKILSNRFHIYLSEEKPDRNVAITTYIYKNTATSISITTGTNDNYLTVYFWVDSDTLTEQEILDTIMINEGEEMLPYEPYGVNELYLKENVGKVVLDGTETYTSVWNYPDVPRYGVAVNLANAVIPTAASQHIQLYSNRFVARTQEELWTAGAYSEGICIRTNNSQLIIKNNNITTATTGSQVVTDFKNWISNNNIKVAYPLATPKYTKISLTNYPILRNQLENIHNNARTYEGQTNIIQTNTDLPFDLEITALKKIDI